MENGMDNITEKAREYNKKGFNCAQAVFCALSEYTGLDEKTALAVSAGFGGGVRCGEICGALSGAVMALGMAFPFNDCDDIEAKQKIADLTRRFIAEFKDEYSRVRCEDIKGAGPSCGDYIAAAAEIAEEIILDNK